MNFIRRSARSRRQSDKNSIESAELLGETEITFSIAGMVSNLSLQEAKIMLAQIQRYADGCSIVTETHKITVNGLTEIDTVNEYDYTEGYPERLEFTL